MSKDPNEEDEEFFLGGKKHVEVMRKKAMFFDRKNRRKKMKVIDPEEYEEQLWVSYVEPQYENEYSRMLASAQKLHKPDGSLVISQEQVQSVLRLFNPNVTIPRPKAVLINKKAIFMREYDQLREDGEELKDLEAPADALPITGEEGDMNSLLWGIYPGSKKRRKKPRKK